MNETAIVRITSLEMFSLWVAKEIMGWKMVHYPPSNLQLVHPIPGLSNWHYAEDMNAAFDIVKWLHSRQDYLTLTYQCGVVEPFDKFYWTALLRYSSTYDYHELPAVAICLAAARSLGVKVNGTKISGNGYESSSLQLYSILISGLLH